MYRGRLASRDKTRRKGKNKEYRFNCDDKKFVRFVNINKSKILQKLKTMKRR